jgi:hypothetical protein
MSRERGRDDMRGAIAVQAARLMAQDGIEDYGLAKRKAARQLGIPDARRLPNNDEIDAARREYRDIYQAGDQDRRIRKLREQAVRAMRELAAFDPHLTGPVLSGMAGPYAAIHLQLFTDNVKAVELFLIDRNIVYRTGQSRLYTGHELRVLPVFSITDADADIELTVLDVRDLRAPLRATVGGRNIERARLPVVAALLDQTR